MKRFRPRSNREIDADLDSIISKINGLTYVDNKHATTLNTVIDELETLKQNVNEKYCKKENCCGWIDLLKKIFNDDNLVEQWIQEYDDYINMTDQT